MSDDIWRPGGSIDREAEGVDDGWSAHGSSMKDDTPLEDFSVNAAGV
jgi:hypothetical protein